MATEQPTMSINGTYAQGQGFSASDQAYASHNAAYNNAPQTSNSQSATSNSAQTVPKDEVGWYFVEQYYTTLSRNPDQLHVSTLFRPQNCLMLILAALLQQALSVRVWG